MAGRVWRDGTRRGIAYVEGRDAALRVLEAAGRATSPVEVRGRTRRAAPVASLEGLPGAMAVYLDRRGRPFAWQIPFDIGCWERISALIGEE